MLLDIRLQMPGPCLPIIGRVADAVGTGDEFVSSVRGSTKPYALCG
jgi:hypothetical protein